MVGSEIRMARLFEKGRAFVVALDHGLVMGPLKGIENPIEVVAKIAKNRSRRLANDSRYG